MLGPPPPPVRFCLLLNDPPPPFCPLLNECTFSMTINVDFDQRFYLQIRRNSIFRQKINLNEMK